MRIKPSILQAMPLKTPSASLRPAHHLLRPGRVGIQFLLNHLYKLKPRGREPPWCGRPHHFLLTQFMKCTTSMDCAWREIRTVCCGHLIPDREIPISLLYSYCLSFVNMNPSGLKGHFSKIFSPPGALSVNNVCH